MVELGHLLLVVMDVTLVVAVQVTMAAVAAVETPTVETVAVDQDISEDIQVTQYLMVLDIVEIGLIQQLKQLAVHIMQLEFLRVEFTM